MAAPVADPPNQYWYQPPSGEGRWIGNAAAGRPGNSTFSLSFHLSAEDAACASFSLAYSVDNSVVAASLNAQPLSFGVGHHYRSDDARITAPLGTGLFRASENVLQVVVFNAPPGSTPFGLYLNGSIEFPCPPAPPSPPPSPPPPSCGGDLQDVCGLDPSWRAALQQAGISSHALCRDYSVSSHEKLWFYRCRSTCVGFGTSADAVCVPSSPDGRRRLDHRDRDRDRGAPLTDLFCAGANHTTVGTAQQQAAAVAAAVGAGGVYSECPKTHHHPHHPSRDFKPAAPPLQPSSPPSQPPSALHWIKGHVAAVLVIFGASAVLLAGASLFGCLYRRWRRAPREPALLSVKAAGEQLAADGEIELRDVTAPPAAVITRAQTTGDIHVAAEAKKAQQAKPKKSPRKPRWGDLAIGQVVFYKHRQHGWIFVTITSIDYEGAHDGGATFMIEAPQIEGVLETGRAQLFVKLPEDAEELATGSRRESDS